MSFKEVVTVVVVVTLMVTSVAGQLSQSAFDGVLNAGTDESDQRLRDVLSDPKIHGFVNCMIKPWGDGCGSRAPIMATMIKFALMNNLQCEDCSTRVTDQMKFIETRLRSHPEECTRLLAGLRYKQLTGPVCLIPDPRYKLKRLKRTL